MSFFLTFVSPDCERTWESNCLFAIRIKPQTGWPTTCRIYPSVWYCYSPSSLFHSFIHCIHFFSFFIFMSRLTKEHIQVKQPCHVHVWLCLLLFTRRWGWPFNQLQAMCKIVTKSSEVVKQSIRRARQKVVWKLLLVVSPMRQKNLMIFLSGTGHHKESRLESTQGRSEKTGEGSEYPYLIIYLQMGFHYHYWIFLFVLPGGWVD